jgi:hypothetical protein
LPEHYFCYRYDSEGNRTSANRAILYEDASKKQLLEFISVLRGCELMFNTCCSLTQVLSLTESTLLHHLLSSGKKVLVHHNLFIFFSAICVCVGFSHLVSLSLQVMDYQICQVF